MTFVKFMTIQHHILPFKCVPYNLLPASPVTVCVCVGGRNRLFRFDLCPCVEADLAAVARRRNVHAVDNEHALVHAHTFFKENVFIIMCISYSFQS